MPVLMVSMFDDPALQEFACQKGASGFVSKSEDGSTLRSAALAVLSGRPWFAPRPAPVIPLTPRQGEVVARMASGQSEKQVASDLGLALRTIEFHVEHAKKSMGARSTGELISIALRRGYLFLLGGINRAPR